MRFCHKLFFIFPTRCCRPLTFQTLYSVISKILSFKNLRCDRQVAKIKGLEKSVCGKDSIPFKTTKYNIKDLHACKKISKKLQNIKSLDNTLNTIFLNRATSSQETA